MTKDEIHERLSQSFPHVWEDTHFEGKGLTVWRCTENAVEPYDTQRLANFALIDGVEVHPRSLEAMIEMGEALFNRTESVDVSCVDVGFFSGYGKIGRSLGI